MICWWLLCDVLTVNPARPALLSELIKINILWHLQPCHGLHLHLGWSVTHTRNVEFIIYKEQVKHDFNDIKKECLMYIFLNYFPD